MKEVHKLAKLIVTVPRKTSLTVRLFSAQIRIKTYCSYRKDNYFI